MPKSRRVSRLRVLLGGLKRSVFSLAHPFVVTRKRVAFGERNHYGVNPTFVTVDIASADECLNFNDTPRLPFADASVEILFTSHSLEHLSEPMVRQFLQEAHRILIPGGQLLVELPDCEFLYKLWVSGQRNLFDELGFDMDVCSELEDTNLALRRDVAFAGIISCKILRTSAGAERHAPIPFRPEEFDAKIRDLPMDDFFSWLIGLQTPDEFSSGGHVSAWYPAKFSRELVSAGFKAAGRMSDWGRVPRFLFRGGDRKTYSFRMVVKR